MSENGYSVSEETWITLKDGTKLATRIWMPDIAANIAVPTVLEFLPYRKRGGTHARDESTYPGFAQAGIAGVRVDIRGSGESEGVIDGEYTPRELSDACEVIEWITQQSWSNGSVGMMGISWGGFNCLQVAALKPKGLKAVISIASTVDRYNDDIHYKNGTHLYAQLSWAATMLAYQSRSPDPALVGDRWKEMWLERLEGEPFFMEEWLSHQRRDAFWKHASICEDFEDFNVPALVIAGWADGYRNTPVKAVNGLGGEKARSMIGPWVHKYPHFAYPKPRADFIGEAIGWWKHWLSGEDNGAENMAPVRAFILDGPKPALWREEDPGFWVSRQSWHPEESDAYVISPSGDLCLASEVTDQNKDLQDCFIRSPLDSGTSSGEWFTLKPDAEMAGDQRADDAGALVFETAPLKHDVTYLGMPELSLMVSCEADWENMVVRVNDVHPDGAVTRATYGVLNLAHRDGNENPVAMPKGQKVPVKLVLDALGYRFKAGHRIRLAIATASWPLILPSPEAPGISFDRASVRLSMPCLGTHEKIDVAKPEDPDPLPHYATIQPAGTKRQVDRDLETGLTTYRIYEDTGISDHPDFNLMKREIRDERWSINADDPLSMKGEINWTIQISREGWNVETKTTSTISATLTDWIITASVHASEAGKPIFVKSFHKVIPRDFM